MSKIDFKTINEKALDSAEKVVSNWVPNGSRNGNEWIALNPTRNDSSKGSFSINLLTGIWKDFATNDAGADLISLVAYVERLIKAQLLDLSASFWVLPIPLIVQQRKSL